MIAITITERKSFMNRLFLTEYFDHFFLSEATFVTFNTFHIDGILKKEYYTPDELEIGQLTEQQYSSWKQIRPFALSLIKGSHTPLEFKIIFRLSEKNVKKLLAQASLSYSVEDVNGLFLNLHFKAGTLTCTTGTSMAFFTLDKSLEKAWDDTIKKYLKDFC